LLVPYRLELAPLLVRQGFLDVQIGAEITEQADLLPRMVR
jgi:hypothetical protein